MNLPDYQFLITFALANFALTMVVLALVLGCLEWIGRKLFRRSAGAGVFYRWLALLALGVTAIYAFVMHAFFAEIAAKTIGWAVTPFQYEVAVANFAIGFIAILSFRASYGFRLATVLAAMCWLWGDAIVHVYEMSTRHNFAIGNAGSWLWIDILLPVLLIICIIKMRADSLPKTYEP